MCIMNAFLYFWVTFRKLRMAVWLNFVSSFWTTSWSFWCWISIIMMICKWYQVESSSLVFVQLVSLLLVLHSGFLFGDLGGICAWCTFSILSSSMVFKSAVRLFLRSLSAFFSSHVDGYHDLFLELALICLVHIHTTTLLRPPSRIYEIWACLDS